MKYTLPLPWVTFLPACHLCYLFICVRYPPGPVASLLLPEIHFTSSSAFQAVLEVDGRCGTVAALLPPHKHAHRKRGKDTLEIAEETGVLLERYFFLNLKPRKKSDQHPYRELTMGHF